MNREIGPDICKPLHIEQIANRDLLCITGNSILCNDLYGKKKVAIRVCVTGLPCSTPETNTTL